MAPKIPAPKPATPQKSLFDDDDDEGWQDMPVIREDEFASGLDEEDRKRFHYVPPTRVDGKEALGIGNATGNLIDFDDYGNEWREKQAANENEYTRLRLNEEDDNDEVHLRTRYLFDEDKAMTPLSQMQATKNLLTEAQRIAYVGLCALIAREMVSALKLVKSKELKHAIEGMELWSLKIMGRLYYHMELATQEQKMIESLAEHGVNASDLVPSLMTTHTVANPEYDPAEARRQSEVKNNEAARQGTDATTTHDQEGDDDDADEQTLDGSLQTPPATTTPKFQTTANVLAPSAPVAIPGVSLSLSSVDENVTLDIRWTVLCDLFLILIADSVYDARSRVLLESAALKLGLGWLDVVKFEQRVTEALEIQEGVEKLEQKEVIEGRTKAARNRRYAMLGLATLGGGLVIGLSAGLLAPVIGAGLGAAFATIGVTGTTGFLAGAGGAAVITTAGTLTGSSIAARGMARRTQHVRTFDLLPMHNNKRVNCILTISGFMTSLRDDVRLPFSVLDPVVGDVFSVHWEPEMLGEAGTALKILTSEVLSQVSTTVLQATVMTALMSALQWPILLTKLGYLIDNPWSNALDRAKAAGSVLADVLMQRHLGVRPITLIGFSLGARVIFYCLLELARQKAHGIVQDVFILGTTVTAPHSKWLQARSVVAGRFVNGYARNDWVLNYLFRATSGGLNSIAGLRPVQNVPGLENVDVTDKIAGHMSYRTFMPLILDQLGFPVSADYFDEPEDPDFQGDRVVVREGEDVPKKKGWFGRKHSKKPSTTSPAARPPPAHTPSTPSKRVAGAADDDDLPERVQSPVSPMGSPKPLSPSDSTNSLPMHAGFDFNAIKEIIGKEGSDINELHAPTPSRFQAPVVPPPSLRSESAPPPITQENGPRSVTPVQRPSLDYAEHVGPDSRRDLATALTRSLSMRDADSDDDVPPIQRPLSFEEEPQATHLGAPSTPRVQHSPVISFGDSMGGMWTPDVPPKDVYGVLGNGHAVEGYTRRVGATRAVSTPTYTFGSADGPVWAPDPPSKNMFNSWGQSVSGQSKDTFSASTATLTFGSSAGGILPAAPVVPHGPSTVSGASLAFGGVDGSVVAGGVTEDRDPWRPPPLVGGAKKSASTFNSNPWQ